MKTSLNPPSVPRSPFYAQGVAVDGNTRTVYVSGQVGVGPDGTPEEGISAQTRRAVQNVHAVLAEAGLGPESVVAQRVYLTTAESVPGFVEAAAAFVGSEPPATTLLVVAGLADPALLVEIEAVAVATA
jgi:2-iminobutanoate/2-iminopropanoate deaminase